jgi:hypothetical protein
LILSDIVSWPVWGDCSIVKNIAAREKCVPVGLRADQSKGEEEDQGRRRKAESGRASGAMYSRCISVNAEEEEDEEGRRAKEE